MSSLPNIGSTSGISDLPSKADISRDVQHVGQVPKADKILLPKQKDRQGADRLLDKMVSVVANPGVRRGRSDGGIQDRRGCDIKG
jgi:hypothetical protein